MYYTYMSKYIIFNVSFIILIIIDRIKKNCNLINFALIIITPDIAYICSK